MVMKSEPTLGNFFKRFEIFIMYEFFSPFFFFIFQHVYHKNHSAAGTCFAGKSI